MDPQPISSLSIIVPVLDEAPSLRELVARIQRVMGDLADRFEVIVVDDGSADGSFAVLEGLRKEDSRLKVIQLRCTHGKATALGVGFKEAQGNVLITMDGDLQDQPEDIPKLLAKLAEGYDLVCGWRVKRKDPWRKVLASRIFNRVTRWLTSVRVHDSNCGLKAFRREVVEGLGIHGELHRYIPVIAQWKGFKVAELPVAHEARRYGASKYGAERFLRGFFDLLTVMMLTRYSRRPLHLFGLFGLAAFVAGTAINLYLIGGWILGKWWLGDRPLLLLGVLLMILGVQFGLFGLLAEMVTYGNRNPDNPSIRNKLT